MARSLPLIETASAGLLTGLKSAPQTFAIFLVPWLASSVLLVALDVYWQNNVRPGSAPDALRELVWAPFCAMIYVGWLKARLHDERPDPAIMPDLSGPVWICAPVVAAWFELTSAIAAAPANFALAVAPDALITYAYMASALAILARTALDALAFGLIFTILVTGQFDVRTWLRLVRLRPFSLYALSFITAIAVSGAERLYSHIADLAGLQIYYPETLIPWREHVLQAFAAEQASFPPLFLRFLIHTGIMAVTFERLRAITQGDDPRVVATFS
jgi:hypothetical protein